jgi:DNA modification methylase
MTANRVGWAIIRGDALRLPLRDATVDLVCTSPPYLWKRKYAIDGTGELGNERDWRAFLNNLFLVTDELLRVLKPTGSIWVDLGDTRVTGTEAKWLGIPVKSKLLLPERYRIGCQDRYANRGVIVRQIQIWEKPNGLPESATDRTRDTHEDWVHLTVGPRYYAALDELREPQQTFGEHHEGHSNGRKGGHPTQRSATQRALSPLGKLPGSVWSIPSEPLRLPPWIGTQHYAAFPTRWPEQLIKAFSPPGICLQCGQGRFPVVDLERTLTRPSGEAQIGTPFDATGPDRVRRNIGNLRTEATILGYACVCCPHTDHPGTGESSGPGHNRTDSGIDQGDGYANVGAGWGGKSGYSDRPKVGPWREWHFDRWTPPSTRPAVVLDPFSGTGCTIHVAKALGRIGIGVDLSEAYCRLASDTTLARQRAAKVHGRTNLERQGVLL